MSDDPHTALRRALEESPGSVRELARSADVDSSLLYRIRDGERRLTPATARAVADVLRSWGNTCHELAEGLEEAADSEQEDGDA